MRGKRSKQYRKLMQQFSLTFGFRPPYQVLGKFISASKSVSATDHCLKVDAQMIQDSEAFKMDLVGGFERTLGDKVKPMITQCSIRHLYTIKDLPQARKDAVISIAKDMERRRCNHHTLDQPLSTLECLSSVIDPKSSKSNPHRYVVASQDDDVRSFCRDVRGVPLIYIKRSVMVMEKMGEKSMVVREGVEKSKFRSGLRARGTGPLGKRKRGDGAGGGDAADADETTRIAEDDVGAMKKKKTKGPKGPNPLAVKQSKKAANDVYRSDADDHRSRGVPIGFEGSGAPAQPTQVARDIVEGLLGETDDLLAKKKRKRKHKSKQLDDIATTINSNNEAG